MKHQMIVPLMNCFAAFLALSGRARALTFVHSHHTSILLRPSISGQYGSVTIPLSSPQMTLPRVRTATRTSTSQRNLFGSAAAAAATTALALPSWKAASLACLAPTCMGFYKREYGVSYAYGKLHEFSAHTLVKSDRFELTDLRLLVADLTHQLAR